MGSFGLRVQVFLALGALVALYNYTPYLLYFLLFCLAAVTGVGLTLLQGLYKLRRLETYPSLPHPKTDSILRRMKLYPKARPQCVLLSANFDSKLQQIIDLTIRNHLVESYQVKIGSDQESYFRCIMPDVWSFLSALHQGIGKIDMVKLLSQDAVQSLKEHHQNIRQQQSTTGKSKIIPHFLFNLEKFSYLQTAERELDFLRQLSDVLLCTFLPKNLLNCTATRILIREYLACQILQPTIERLCDPDFINQKLLAYLSRREETAKSAQRNYGKYPTFEKFMKHLRFCKDPEELKYLREYIITDIIQAKAVHKMKHSRSTGIQEMKFPIPIPAQKAEMLMSRSNLPGYIKQLGLAKDQCEKQIKVLSGEDYSPHEQAAISQIPFEYIMTSEKGRTCLLQFLEKRHCHLLYCWITIENLKSCKENEVRDKAQQIYSQFLAPTAESYIDPDTNIVISIEMYLGGNDQHFTAMFELQEYIYTEIHGKYYYSFLCSEEYAELKEQISSERATINSLMATFQHGTGEADDGDKHKQKLKALKKKHEEKSEEMVELSSEQAAGLEHRKKLLEKDLGNISHEISQIEHYLEHTEQYYDTIGEWIVRVFSVDIEEANSRDPLFVLLVQHLESVHEEGHLSRHLSSSSDEFEILQNRHEESLSPSVDTSSENLPRMRDGWVVGRRLSEFEELHTKVAPLCGHHLKLPATRRQSILPSFGDTKEQAKKQWETYREQLQVYVNKLTSSPVVMESEYMFHFLSSASDNFRKSNAILKRSTLASLLHFRDHSSDDAIVEPMYSLFIEVFELENFTGMVRKQLIDLIQFTFGTSISRQLHATVSWMVSEPMLIYYLENYQEAMWPGGSLNTSLVTRSDEEKAETKELAREKLLKNMSIVMQTLISKNKCQIGLKKIFDAFQDSRANKQLFYSILELCVCSLVPELREIDVGT